MTRSGFLPAEHQGTSFSDSETEPEKMIQNLQNKWLDARTQRRQLDALQAINREYGNSFGQDDYLEGRIKSMEGAYRMQFEAMDVFDIRKESQAVRDEYGDNPFGTRLPAGAPAGGARRALRPCGLGQAGTTTRTSRRVSQAGARRWTSRRRRWSAI